MQHRLRALTRSITPILIFSASLTVVACQAHADDLTQKEAEELSSRIYINQCGPDQRFTETVKVAPAEKQVLWATNHETAVYPVQRTMTAANCTEPQMGRKFYWANVQAKYTTTYYKDKFGNWQHSPVLGSCSATKVGVQVDGQARMNVNEAGSCSFNDKGNP